MRRFQVNPEEKYRVSVNRGADGGLKNADAEEMRMIKSGWKNADKKMRKEKCGCGRDAGDNIQEGRKEKLMRMGKKCGCYIIIRSRLFRFIFDLDQLCD